MKITIDCSEQDGTVLTRDFRGSMGDATGEVGMFIEMLVDIRGGRRKDAYAKMAFSWLTANGYLGNASFDEPA